jgi:hypothetical protein
MLKIQRVITIDVKKFTKIPILKTTAKPLIGPVPKNIKTMAVSRVVMFASRMVLLAFE